MIRLVLVLLLVSTTSYAQNTTIESFGKAKKILANMHALFHGETFYCSCLHDMKTVSHKVCGYKGKGTRSKRIEWEHVVPASAFGQKFKEWTDGHPECRKKGRACANKVSKKYRLMQADLHNLQPAIGEINAKRSNYPPGIIPGEEREFGSCDFEIKGKLFEPKEDIRGDIARTYFYMNWAYPGFDIINDLQAHLFLYWNRVDPPSQWEFLRNLLILKEQGNRNPFIYQP